MTNVLKESNYPKSFLYDCLRHPTLTDCKSSEGDSAVKGFAIVPYIQGIAETIRRVLNNFALKPFRTLGHIFAEPKDRCPIDRKTNAVYSIPCGDCEKVYLGQTKRQLCTRLKKHQRLFLILIAQNQLCPSTCVQQAITLRGTIIESLPLIIVIVNGFVWKPGISMRALVPY